MQFELRNCIPQALMNKKILIGLSTGEHIRRAEFLPSFLSIEKPDGTLTITVHGQSPAKSRNLIIEQALKNDCTHILFVDDDMVLAVDTLLRLEKHNENIVSALYLLRMFPHRPAAFDKTYDNGKCKFMSLDADKEGLVEVVNCGLGCVLIATDVFRILDPPWVRLGEIESDEWCDDIGFFNRCREAGFKIFCDTATTVGHMSNLTIWPERTANGWMTNYKHPNGNIHIHQHILTAEEVEKQERDNLVNLHQQSQPLCEA